MDSARLRTLANNVAVIRKGTIRSQIGNIEDLPQNSDNLFR